VVPAIPERCWSALWHILAGCGLRPGEALALRWQEIDQVGQKLRVRRNLIRVPGSKGYQLLAPKTKKSKREVPIPAPVWNELKRSRKVQKHQRMHSGEAWQDAGFVLTNSKGGPLHDVRRAFERVSARAGLGEWGEEPKREHVTGPVPKRQFTPAFRIYDCRHTYVTLLLMAGTPVNAVADLVGHEKASFTIARYGHALPKQTKEAVATLEAVLFKRTG
jgi:integrase